MLYSILIYGVAGTYDQLPKAAQDHVMQGHRDLQGQLETRGDYVSVKLMPPSSAVTVNPAKTPDQPPLVVDGPFADTKESFLGFHTADFADLEDAIDHARVISSPIVRIEVRPVSWAGGVISSEGSNVGVA